MAFYEDAELAKDKQTIKSWKDAFDGIVSECGNYIDRITQDRYGDMAKYTDTVNRIKLKLGAMKIKYPSAVVEIDGYLTIVDTQIDAVKTRWDTEVYNKINA